MTRRKSYSCNFPSHLAFHRLLDWVADDVAHRSFVLKFSPPRRNGAGWSGGFRVSVWSKRSRKKGEKPLFHIGPGFEEAIDKALSWAEERGWWR